MIRKQPTRTAAAGYRDAFTLVELLVVIGLIAILIGLLLPALTRARKQAMQTACLANLSQIHAAARAYSNDYHDHLPDAETVGNFIFRMAPGQRTRNDHAAMPEVFGLPAILHGIGWGDDLSGGIKGKGRYISAASGVWVCRAEPEYMREYGNTYCVSINTIIGTYTSIHRGRPAAVNTPWLFDNYSSYPGLSGYRGPFSGYTIPSAQWIFPHNISNKSGAVNMLFLDGHTELKKIQ